MVWPTARLWVWYKGERASIPSTTIHSAHLSFPIVERKNTFSHVWYLDAGNMRQLLFSISTCCQFGIQCGSYKCWFFSHPKEIARIIFLKLLRQLRVNPMQKNMNHHSNKELKKTLRSQIYIGFAWLCCKFTVRPLQWT